MSYRIVLLKEHLIKCGELLNKGYTNAKYGDIHWLNNFSAEFLKYANVFHDYISHDIGKCRIDGNEHLETIFLCLTQVTICIKYMERIIKAEQIGGTVLTPSRLYFLDRLHWCIERMRTSLQSIKANNLLTQQPLEEQTFVQLMDLVLEYLAPFSTYQINKNTNIANKGAQTMFNSIQIRHAVDLILGHTLAFANVALQQDKKALSALCQKVLRECCDFQDECALINPDIKTNDCHRKLKATSLENALCQLEDFINEALLRLVYTCFLDYDRFSIEKLRNAICRTETNDSIIDELIADFDVNIDRTTQIGIFAIAFAPNVKLKTILRNCLASLESLDTCLVPTLQSKLIASIHSDILEQHFNEEITIFKHILQEIIDSSAFVSCYLDILTECLNTIERNFEKSILENVLQMGEYLHEHFQLNVNQKLLQAPGISPERQRHYKQFVQMLRECKAVMLCMEQVDHQRIIKRFKVLRTVLRKFYESLSDCAKNAQKRKNNSMLMMMTICAKNIHENQIIFESCGITPSVCSILYNHDSRSKQRRRAVSDSLKGNYSKLTTNLYKSTTGNENMLKECVRRKESLRTVMFKRQNLADSDKFYNMYKAQSESTQISEILNKLTRMSTIFSVGAVRNIELVASI